ncbi:hypothetical protein OMK73_03050 [Cupriavidus sp. D39]|nr:hypothetical protein [Cupriavidus sp. D39]MCY0852921.1 hypothetical protein [Cupriavidus sp. D39]
MKFHATPQVENPGLLVVFRLLPAFGQSGPYGCQAIGMCQIPQHQSLENRIAEEAHAFPAVIGHAGGGRDIGCGHGDAQRIFGLGRRDQRSGQAQGQGPTGENWTEATSNHERFLDI